MHWLIRYYNQNRKKIWLAIIVIVFAILTIQVLNESAKIAIEKENKNQNKEKKQPASMQDNYTYSVMSDEQISTSETLNNNGLVEKFIEYCNMGNTESAYNLLSNECKEELYPTLQDFIDRYHSQAFKTAKTYSMQGWYSENVNTYKIRLLNDMLSTGKYDNSEIIEDYYTIIETEEGSKLNINGYVGRSQINKEIMQDNNLYFAILTKDYYIDYEIYTINIKNDTGKTIMLDSKEKSSSTYLVGTNGAEFSAYMFELADQDLIIESGNSNIIKIKYNKMYNPEVEIDELVFSDIIQDYPKYQNTVNKKRYQDRINVTIDIAR